MRAVVRAALTALASLTVAVGLAPVANASVGEPVDVPVEFQEAVAVTDQYWADSYEAWFGQPYVPPNLATGARGVPGMVEAFAVLPDGSTTGTDLVACGGQPLTPDNAMYCPIGDVIAFDADLLDRSLQLGDSFLYLAVAHEWAHAVVGPTRAWQLESPTHWELQADCVAGATLRDMGDGGYITFEQGDAEEVYAGLVAIGRDPSIPWGVEANHGTPQERIAHFDLGFSSGMPACFGGGWGLSG